MKIMKVKVEFVENTWLKERNERKQLKDATKKLKELNKWLEKSPAFRAQYEAMRNPV